MSSDGLAMDLEAVLDLPDGRRASLRLLAAEKVAVLLERVSWPQPACFHARLGVALIDGDGVIVGVGAAGGAAEAPAARATIVVREDWRDHGAEVVLLRGLAAVAGEAGLQSLTISYATDNTGAERLVQSCGLLTAKRVVGNATTVILVVGDWVAPNAAGRADARARPREASSLVPT